MVFPSGYYQDITKFPKNFTKFRAKFQIQSLSYPRIHNIHIYQNEIMPQIYLFKICYIRIGYFHVDRSVIACFGSRSVKKMPHCYRSGILDPTAWLWCSGAFPPFDSSTTPSFTPPLPPHPFRDPLPQLMAHDGS